MMALVSGASLAPASPHPLSTSRITPPLSPVPWYTDALQSQELLNDETLPHLASLSSFADSPLESLIDLEYDESPKDIFHTPYQHVFPNSDETLSYSSPLTPPNVPPSYKTVVADISKNSSSPIDADLPPWQTDKELLKRQESELKFVNAAVRDVGGGFDALFDETEAALLEALLEDTQVPLFSDDEESAIVVNQKDVGTGLDNDNELSSSGHPDKVVSKVTTIIKQGISSETAKSLAMAASFIAVGYIVFGTWTRKRVNKK
ncbi:hypothetical protein HDU79_008252 [Rhizoclosmatium sp. JEL0117]|nr:hypothetical protein HDU79_008252 [Rhizoclosmatium sp. JEL0117]